VNIIGERLLVAGIGYSQLNTLGMLISLLRGIPGVQITSNQLK